MYPLSEPALVSCSHPILVLVSTCYLLPGSASLILSRARSADCDVTAVDVEWSCAPALSAHTSCPLSVTLPRPSTPVAVTRHVCPRALWPFTRFNGETSGRNTGQCRNTRLCCGLVKWFVRYSRFLVLSSAYAAVFWVGYVYILVTISSKLLISNRLKNHIQLFHTNY